MFASIREIEQNGFSGFLPISDLQSSRCSEVPSESGLYLILNPMHLSHEFMTKGTGGNFKKKDPNVLPDVLSGHWVDSALVLYIGKAGHGKTSTLRSRLNYYMQFGLGRQAAHSGGRYIWQLSNSSQLHVCWKAMGSHEIPRLAERELIGQFHASYGKRPFANLRA